MKLLVAMLLLVGCAKDPIAVDRTDNPEVNIHTLFTHNGCTVYRFYDNGYRHYFSDCRGSVTSRVSCGKNCTRPTHVMNLGR